MSPETNETVPRICPITGGVCTCEHGPGEDTIPVEVNGEMRSMTIQRCGEIALKETLAKRIQKQLRQTTFDD